MAQEVKTYLKAINSILAIAFLLALGSHIDISPAATGNFYEDREEEASCEFNNRGESREVPIDRCCYRASMEVECSKVGDKVYCGTDSRNYSLNHVATDRCREKGFELE